MVGWAEYGQWSQASVLILALPFTNSVTLTMLFDLSELQFPHLSSPRLLLALNAQGDI